MATTWQGRLGVVSGAVALGCLLWAGCRAQPAPPLVMPSATVPQGPVAAPAAAPAPPPPAVAVAAVSAPPATAAPQKPADDPIADLIASLERQYAAAMQMYRRGQLDEARRGFDATLDRLLATSYSIPDTPRLQAELDSLLDRTHALESDLMASGGLNSAKPQAAARDRVPELTFPLDPATRAQIEKDTEAVLAKGKAAADALPLTINDVVLRYIHYFTTTGKEGYLDDLRRGGRYRAMADRIFQSVGVPTDLFYLAQLESSFDPTLVSRAGARGMWQFMAARSDDYDLQRTRWVDERDDPEKATLAAAHHLKDLHAEFGDWYLAMAAYNAGPRTIQEIVARTGYADYWQLYRMNALPKYLRNYVPVIVAMALIAKDPERYGLEAPVPDAPVEVDREGLKAALSLRLAADCADVTVADLQRLNPSLLHLQAPAGFELKLPQGTAARFERALARVPARDRLDWRVHWAQAGEGWNQLATRFHVSRARLLAANEAEATVRPVPGDAVVLPLAAAAAPAASSRRRGAQKPKHKKSLTTPHD